MPSSERSPRTVRLLTVAVIAGTFATGLTSGAGLHRWAATDNAPPPPPLISPRVMGQLDLSAEQKKQAHSVFERHRPKLEAIFHETFPRVRAEKEQAEKEIRAILTPEQRTKLDVLGARRRPHGAPPPEWGPPPSHGDKPQDPDEPPPFSKEGPPPDG